MGGEGDDRGWDGWVASPTQRTWVWVNSRSWWWTGRPGMLQSMGSQRVRHDWATELKWTEQSEARLIFLKLAFNQRHSQPLILSTIWSSKAGACCSVGEFLHASFASPTLPSPCLFFSKHQHWFLYILKLIECLLIPLQDLLPRDSNSAGKRQTETSCPIWTLSPLNMSCMTLGKFLSLSVLQFPKTQTGLWWLLLRGLN